MGWKEKLADELRKPIKRKFPRRSVIFLIRMRYGQKVSTYINLMLLLFQSSGVGIVNMDYIFGCYGNFIKSCSIRNDSHLVIYII